MICNSLGEINTYNPVLSVLSPELSVLPEGGVPWAAVLIWAQIKLFLSSRNFNRLVRFASTKLK